MKLFNVLVLSVNDPERWKSFTLENDGRLLQIASDVWIYAGNGVSKEVSDRIGMTDGSVLTGIVTEIAGHFGRAPTHIWEWMQDRLTAA